MPLAGKTKRDVLVEFRHAEILDAARHVFARRGFAQASMEEISHAAGLAKGTLYLYYRSKQDLYRAALHAGLVDLCTLLERAVEVPAPVEERIRAFISTKIGYFETHRDFFRIYSAELGLAATGLCDKAFRELCRRQVRLLQSVLRDDAAKEASRLAADEASANAIMDLMRGVISRRLTSTTTAPVEDDVNFVVNFAQRALVNR